VAPAGANAAEQLAESGDEAHSRLAHARYFASLAEQATLDDPTREDQADWLDRLTAEHENFRTALDVADSRALVDVELRLVKVLRSFLFRLEACASAYDAARAAQRRDGRDRAARG
jgi:hypothetical protein